MHLSVTKLPAFSINGTGFINMTEKERKEVSQFSCKFHGDFNLKTHPGTYEEAIKVYKELPSLLGEHYQHSVPVKVFSSSLFVFCIFFFFCIFLKYSAC